MESEERKQKYNEYVERITPNNKLFTDVFNAFWIGGIICLMGQIWVAIFTYFGMNKEDAAAWTTLVLILESVILTGLNIFNKIGKFAGAGSLIPITGFANSIVSPAIEYKSEGYVMGVGGKMFTVAGPVLVFGISTSVIIGIIATLFFG